MVDGYTLCDLDLVLGYVCISLVGGLPMADGWWLLEYAICYYLPGIMVLLLRLVGCYISHLLLDIYSRIPSQTM